MQGRIDKRLAALGLTLPTPAPPAAHYLPFVRSGSLVFIAGQLPMGPDGLAFRGTLGLDLDVAAGQAAARLCALNVIAQVKAACEGDLDRVHHCVRLGGFVSATPAFVDHPAVVNSASDLMADVFGEAGRHARAAVGVASLPFGAAVEIEAIFETR